jgi:uncharacterized protein YkvS
MSGMVAGQLPIAASATSVTSSVATLAASFMPAYSGDVTSPAGSTVNTLPNVNANVGSFQGLTVNAKGQITAAASQTGQVLGTATNNNAAVGNVGEFISGLQAVGAACANSVLVTLATISLTAGDWDVEGEVWMIGASGMTLLQAGINTSAALPGSPALVSGFATQAVTGGTTVLAISRVRYSLASTTNVFLLVLQAGATTATGLGKITARRAR